MKIMRANTVSISDLELKNTVSYMGQLPEIIPPQSNERLKSFEETLRRIEENNVKVILFVVPRHQYYLTNTQSNYEMTFEQILNKLQQDGFKVYKRNQNYSALPMWHDLTHIAVNKNSYPFNQDVAKMIQDELN